MSSSENTENICVVCFKNVEIYSIGSCDHMVCYECSTRMRVLCRQNECPICRQDLPKVIFTCTVRPFNEIQNCSLLEDKKFKICFQNKKIQDAFCKLLEHSCSMCTSISPFKTFQNLYDHMKKQHDLYYCDLCVENLKIFTSERQCYSYKSLEQHKRKGDADDRSHRGHPLCQFCDVHFMDNDCLYRHLRRDHLFCHFCDADGFDLYYSSYDYLREHFRTEHYLCEEGSCIDEKFTPVFRTDIDLKAHRASAHGRTLGKAAAKQARTLELEFTLKPRARQLENSKRGRAGHTEASSFSAEGAVGGEVKNRSRTNLPNLDSSEFPSLPTGPSSAPVTLPQQRGRNNGLTIHAFGRRNAPLDITDENFPVLGVYNDNSVPGTSVRLNINQDRGAIAKNGSGAPRNLSIHVNHRSNGEQKIKIRQDDFPSLTSDKKSQPGSTTAKWASISSRKPEAPSGSTSLASKTPKLNGIEDFPSLNSKFSANLNLKANEPSKPNFVNVKTYKNSKGEEQKEKKASSVTIPVQSNWSEVAETSVTSTNNLRTKSKKKKSKANNVEEKSDTAKKKQTAKEVETKSDNKGNEKCGKDCQNSALPLSNSDPSVPVKPLPKVEDWFEGLKKRETTHSKSEDEEFNCSTSDVSSHPNKFNLTNLTAVSNSSSGGTAKNNFCSTGKGLAGNGETKIPPGFDKSNGCFNPGKLKKPPPGFSADFPLSNGLTFTNSSGQSYSIPVGFDYIPPVDFDERNQKLVSKVNKFISNDGNLDRFRKNSILFRQDVISASEYYGHCLRAMDEKGLEEVFPELLALLPDINKQQELFRVYSGSPHFSRTKGKGLETCGTCRQIISTNDAKQHFLNHSLQQNFPSLEVDRWTK